MLSTRFRSHPGEVLLLDFIKRHGLTAAQVARDIGLSQRRMGDVVRGHRPLTAELSLRLGRYFGISERFWIRLQTDYDVAMERQRLGRRLEREVTVLGGAR
jgi:addiction module HigA family antidote